MTILRDFIDAQRVHCDRLTSIILHHAAQPEPVTIERGNTADLADIEAMRGILDGAGYAPTPDGLRLILEVVERLDQVREEAEAARERLIYITDGDPKATLAELVSAAGEALGSLREGRNTLLAEVAARRAGRDVLAAEVADLRAQIAALTPGPWIRLGDMAPDEGEIVLMRTGVVGLPWMQFVDEGTVQHLPATYLWRRFPAGILVVPVPTVTP